MLSLLIGQFTLISKLKTHYRNCNGRRLKKFLIVLANENLSRRRSRPTCVSILCGVIIIIIFIIRNKILITSVKIHIPVVNEPIINRYNN